MCVCVCVCVCVHCRHILIQLTDKVSEQLPGQYEETSLTEEVRVHTEGIHLEATTPEPEFVLKNMQLQHEKEIAELKQEMFSQSVKV